MDLEFSEDQKREIALRLAIQNSSCDSSPSEVVEKAKLFFAFLNAQ